MGAHSCAFCRFGLGPKSHRELFIPDTKRGVVYIAPELTAHYIIAHAYAPPAQFMDAVDACPEMRSLEYLQALRALGMS